MKHDFLVESRSYDNLFRGSWQAYSIAHHLSIGNEQSSNTALDEDLIRLWLPSGTSMNWSSGRRLLRNNCMQFFWPGRWYMLSAFYKENTLLYTYGNIIRPFALTTDGLSYVDLDLSVLFQPDLSYEVLTQAEFDHMAEMLHYDEDVRVSALMALQSLTSVIQRSNGFLTVVPHQLHLERLPTLQYDHTS
jgi:protein associated with RNAse G/E